MSTERRPIGEVLHGLELVPLDDGDTPVACLALIEVLGSDGNSTYYVRGTIDFDVVRTIGALHALLHHTTVEFEDGWEAD